jgi:hypothetical protein
VIPAETQDAYDAGAQGLARVARAVGGATGDAEHEAGRARFIAAVSRSSRGSTSRKVALLAAAACLAVAVAVAFLRKPPRLEYRVVGSPVAQGDWLGVDPAAGPLSLRFSDGTEVDLGPGSKGRVAEVTADGARVVLGGGVLQARVVHRPRTHWTVAAGPYSIEVTGTAFDVGWSEAAEKLELNLHDGSVVVRGPSLPDGIRVSAGQRLVARAATGDAELSSSLAPPPEASAPAVEESRQPTPSQAGGGGRVSSRPAPAWSEMLADGNFRGVVDAAEARGIDATIGRASLPDLVALSDAARYLRDRPLARRGLLAERSRFAASPEARGAAFILGRMAEDEGMRDDALRWYGRYLTESPQGSFAAEALGRKLVVLVDAGDASGARSVAREYLARFPAGAHASYAREHLSAQ